MTKLRSLHSTAIQFLLTFITFVYLLVTNNKVKATLTVLSNWHYMGIAISVMWVVLS